MINVDTNDHLNIMRGNEIDFFETEYRLVKEAKELYGDDIFDNIYLPNDFDLKKLDINLAEKYDLQECQLPFGNDTIYNLIRMPKTLINEVFNYNHKGRSIHGAYLLGKHNEKYVLFLLRIESPVEHKNFTNFKIKLDACIQGKAWFSILRLDSSGHPHPNYIKNGKVVKTQEEMSFARTPHLHIADHITQVLTDTVSYSLAQELPFFDYENQSVNDKFMFKKMVKYFLKISNIKAKMNKNIRKNYFYSKSEPLFDYEVPSIEKPCDLEKGPGYGI